MQLRGDRERFERAGATVVLVGLGSVERAAWFRRDKDIPYPCLADPERDAYGAFGVPRGTLAQVLGPQNALRFARLQLRPETRQRGVRDDEDWRQLGATFVVDPGGVIRYVHRNRAAEDNPPNEEVLALLEGLRQRRAEGPRP